MGIFDVKIWIENQKVRLYNDETGRFAEKPNILLEKNICQNVLIITYRNCS